MIVNASKQLLKISKTRHIYYFKKIFNVSFSVGSPRPWPKSQTNRIQGSRIFCRSQERQHLAMKEKRLRKQILWFVYLEGY